MIRNYFIIAIRNIFRNKLFSVVNIFGLAFGISSAMLIFLWVNDELRMDAFHTNKERLYRVMENQTYSDGRLFTFSSTPGPMAPYIKEKFPEIEKASRFTWEVNNLFSYDEKSFYEPGRYVDQDFIQMFSFELLAGNPETALRNKDEIIISQTMAKKYFGDQDPIGKILMMNTKTPFTVTGVLKEIPQSSSIKFEYLLPFAFFYEENKSWLAVWDNNNIRTFLLLQAGADPNVLSAKLKHEVKNHVEKTNVELFIQPFADAYLYGDFENVVQSGGRIENVKIFFIVAVFVLIIACINFMNLATAQATKRAKEVGLRKVIGAMPRQLFRQFMGESFLTVGIAAIIAIVLVLIFIPTFSEISGKNIGLDLLDHNLVLLFISIVLFTSFVAGIYPSLFIAEFKPVQVLKGQLKSGARAAVFRKCLVVLQFSLSIILIICTSVVFRQMHFMQNRDIGFERNNLIYAWMEGDIGKHYQTFRHRLMKEPGIESVTASSQLPIDIGNSTSGVDWEGKDPDERILFSNLNVDYNFIQSMKMTMVDGRPFNPDLVTDTLNFIVNEKAAAKFGFEDAVAGQDLTFWEEKGKIIGVVKDFNFGSLHHPIEPLIMYINPASFNCILIRARQGENETALKSAEKLWKEYAPGYPFKYSFLNQDWEEYYKAEGQQGKIFNTLAVLSIFISCLGLFGLSAFSAERRTKELGIRKVLGASVPGLVQLMNKEFTLLVGVSAIIGCPMGWYLMTGWLNGYAYHVEIGYLTMIVAACVCLVIALVTVSYHSIKVSATNPVKSLRYE